MRLALQTFLATAALAEPKVTSYVNQWDIITIPSVVHAMMASTYTAEITTETFKDDYDSGRSKIGLRASGRVYWTLNFGINVFDHAWLIVTTNIILVEGHPLNVYMAMPDYFDQYADAKEGLPTCYGVNSDIAFLPVSTNISVNFKKFSWSVLDVFNRLWTPETFVNVPESGDHDHHDERAGSYQP